MDTASEVDHATSQLHSLDRCSALADIGNIIKQRILLSNMPRSERCDQTLRGAIYEHFEEEECYSYIVNNLGLEQALPATLNIQSGTACILKILGERYGIYYQKRFVCLLQAHLRKKEGTSTVDHTLWRQWRADFEVTGVSRSAPL